MPRSTAAWRKVIISALSPIGRSPKLIRIQPSPRAETSKPLFPSVRFCMICLLSGARYKGDRHSRGLRANDAAHDPGSVSIVFGVVGRVDRGVHVRSSFGEGHVPFETTGPDATGTARLRAAEPRIGRPTGRADVEIVADPDAPYRHVGAQRAVRAYGRQLQLLCSADLRELVACPCVHWCASFCGSSTYAECQRSIAAMFLSSWRSPAAGVRLLSRSTCATLSSMRSA